jgi:hypothetical protein
MSFSLSKFLSEPINLCDSRCSGKLMCISIHTRQFIPLTITSCYKERPPSLMGVVTGDLHSTTFSENATHLEFLELLLEICFC